MSSKPTFILAVDCETTGLAPTSLDPTQEASGKTYQAIQWGICVLNYDPEADDTFDVVDHYERNVKWNGTSEWSAEAERVHGLSKEHLEQTGVDEEEAAVEIAELIMKYWNKSPVIVLGHNVHFDKCFLHGLLTKFEIPVRFSNRVIDTNTIGMVFDGTTNSNELFEKYGFEDRQEHNALQDILQTVYVARQARKKYRRT